MLTEQLHEAIFIIWHFFSHFEMDALEKTTKGEQLGVNSYGKSQIGLMLSELKTTIDNSKNQITNEEFNLANGFYNACYDFYANSLKQKGFFTKYYEYTLGDIINCKSKLDSIYRAIFKF